MALATAVLSDRAGIVLVIVIAPIVALLLRHTLFRTVTESAPRPRRPGLWITVGVAASVTFTLLLQQVLNIGPLTTLVSSIGSFFGVAQVSGEGNQSIRSDQAWHLMDAWALNPIFGAGFGSNVPGYAYASEIPWSLELQYHLLLFNVGLVGVMIAIGAVIVGLAYLRKAVVARPDLTPIMVSASTGAVAMLIANATNPYLVAPGHQWALFLPIAVACVAIRMNPWFDTSDLSNNGGGRVVPGTPRPE